MVNARSVFFSMLLSYVVGAPVPTAQELVRRAAEKMGGEAVLRAILARSIRSTETHVLNFAQEDWPGAPKPLASGPTTEYQDWRGRRVHSSRPITFTAATGVPTPLAATIVGPGGGGLRVDTVWRQAPADFLQAQRVAALLASPDYVVRVALDSVSVVSDAGRRVHRGRPVSGISVRIEGALVRVWFDDLEGLPVLLDWRSDASAGIAGEMTVEFGFWSRFGDQLLPRIRKVAVNGELLRIIQVRTIENVPSLDDSLFAFPPNLATPLVIPISVTEPAPNIWRLAGATHSSIAVRNAREILLLEAPVSRGHSQAVLDTLRSRFPDTPVRRFLSSHFHGDHSGGATALFDAGLEALVPEDQVEFFRRLDVKWDAQAPGRRRVTGVRQEMVVGSGASRVVVDRIPTSHAWGLLVAFVPAHGILFEADLQNSGQATLKELRDFVTAKGWTVKQVAGVHGPLITWDEFLAKIR
jgi:hypothetical protein